MKRIWINRHAIEERLHHGTDDPYVVVDDGPEPSHYGDVVIDGPCTIRYSKDPVQVGAMYRANVWIETDAEVKPCAE